MKGKKIYQQPETVVTRVELESPICSGSTQFKGEEASGVNIASQEVIQETTNDFSENPWGIIEN